MIDNTFYRFQLSFLILIFGICLLLQLLLGICIFAEREETMEWLVNVYIYFYLLIFLTSFPFCFGIYSIITAIKLKSLVGIIGAIILMISPIIVYRAEDLGFSHIFYSFGLILILFMYPKYVYERVIYRKISRVVLVSWLIITLIVLNIMGKLTITPLLLSDFFLIFIILSLALLLFLAIIETKGHTANKH